MRNYGKRFFSVHYVSKNQSDLECLCVLTFQGLKKKK